MATQVTNMLAPTISATSDKVSFESSWALSTWDEEWDSIQSWWEFYYTSDKAHPSLGLHQVRSRRLVHVG